MHVTALDVGYQFGCGKRPLFFWQQVKMQG
jgi:hypothetical protein